MEASLLDYYVLLNARSQLAGSAFHNGVTIMVALSFPAWKYPVNYRTFTALRACRQTL
jgi:hypothetical protein